MFTEKANSIISKLVKPTKESKCLIDSIMQTYANCGISREDGLKVAAELLVKCKDNNNSIMELLKLKPRPTDDTNLKEIFLPNVVSILNTPTKPEMLKCFICIEEQTSTYKESDKITALVEILRYGVIGTLPEQLN